jgi:predicted permease
MSSLRVLAARLLASLTGRRRDAELTDEIQAHLELLAEEHRRRGMSAAAARAAARRDFGGVAQIEETYRDQRGLPVVETVLQDLRYGIRMLRKAPGFTSVAVLSLALGIGANTAVFTFIDALLLRSLPVPNAQELVEVTAQRRGAFAALSFPMYRDLRERQDVFTGMFATNGETPTRLTIPAATGGASAQLDNMRVAFVSGTYFAVLGVRPVLGRLLTEDDDRQPEISETVGSVIVISENFWRQQFGRDPGVLGRAVVVGRSRCTIVGVVSAPFVGESVGAAAMGWVPLVPFSDRSELDNRRGAFASYVARLRPGVSRDGAQAAMTRLFQQLRTADDGVRGPNGVDTTASADYTIVLSPAATGIDLGLRRQFGKPLRIVMIIVALVLMIACANVASLLLERATSRRGEIGVRLAIGCSRGRLLRQLMTEAVLLSALGALAGAAVAYAGTQGLLRLVDSGAVPLGLDVMPNRSVLAFLIVTSLLCSIGFGLVPALRAIRVDVAPALQGARRGSGGRARGRVGRALVIAQIAASLVLVVTAGLLIRSLANLHGVDYGFVPDKAVIFDLAGGDASLEPAMMAAQARRVYQAVGQVPGVRSASVSSALIFSRGDATVPLTIRGYTPSPDERPAARFNLVSAAYLETIGMTLTSGRSLSDEDRLGRPLVAVVNEAMARRYFPAGGAVGGVVEIDARRAATRTPGSTTGAFGQPIHIVGIVRDAKYNNLREAAKPLIYLSIEQFPRNLRSLEVRTDAPLSAVVGPVRRALSQGSPEHMVRRVVSLSDQVDQTIAAEILVMRLCSLFGGLALLLASVGLYGVLAYAVAQRTSEIGIRMALGATARSVRWLIVRETWRTVAIGVAVGLAASLMSTRLVASLLFGLTATNPGSIVSAVIVLAVAAALAATVPVRRAVRVDPMVALRHE